MTLYMDRRAFSWDYPLPLLDQHHRTRYTVTGDAYAPGKRLRVLDLSGRTAVSIRQRFPSLLPRYELEVYGKPVGALVKDLRCAPIQYTVENLGWTLSGSVARWDYALVREQTPLALCRPSPDADGLLELSLPEGNSALSALGVMVTVNCVLAFQVSSGRS